MGLSYGPKGMIRRESHRCGLRTKHVLLVLDLLLLFLDRVQHRPDNRVVVHQQVAFVVLRHRFRDDSLHLLRDHSDVFVQVTNAHGIVGLVAIANRMELENLAQPGIEIAVRVFEPVLSASGAARGRYPLRPES